VKVLLKRRVFAAQVLHTCVEAGSRPQVSEPIGLGISSPHERVRIVVGGARVGLKPNACPWPVKSRLAELWLGHPSGRLVEAAKVALTAGLELRSGATLGVVSGVRSIKRLCSTIVLIAEVDTRRAVLATPGQ
jgi:hypothetical protein